MKCRLGKPVLHRSMFEVGKYFLFLFQSEIDLLSMIDMHKLQTHSTLERIMKVSLAFAVELKNKSVYTRLKGLKIKEKRGRDGRD